MRFLGLIGVFSLALLTGACNDDQGLEHEQNQRHKELQKSFEWSRQGRLIAANSCRNAEEALKAKARQEMELSLDQSMQCMLSDKGCYYAIPEHMDGAAPPEASGTDDNANGPDDYSDTNVQVAGVDEADIVKTDGKDIVGIYEQHLVLTKAWPPEDLENAATVRIAGTPTGLYLDDEKVVVLSRARGPSYAHAYRSNQDLDVPASLPSDDGSIEENWPMRGTIVTVLQRRNDTLTLQNQHFFEGDYVDSRRIDHRLYLALSHQRPAIGVRDYPDVNLHNASEKRIRRAFEDLRQQNIDIINALPLEYWVPQRYLLNASQAPDIASQKPLTDCENIYTTTDFSGAGNLVSVVTYDFNNDAVSASTIQGEWGTVYASPNAFYLASTNWGWNGWWGADDDADYGILTQIHKFAFEGEGDAQYAASGAVEGYTLNQFSLDEYQDHLRVATTTSSWGWNRNTTSESHVTILQEHDGRLESTGMVSGLGVGESIYAVRFMGDKGYVVTFRQIDPLYVLDLSDPTAPETAGELEIPGYSTYMHPLKNDQLLTIGRDADMDGRVGGLKLEIFDVSEPAAPSSVTTYVLGADWNVQSEALYDHKAFMYFPARQLLAIPVSRWDADNYHYGSYRSELHVFRIDDDAIVPIGVIDHTALFDQDIDMSLCPVWPLRTYLEMRRGIFMDDILYSVSTDGIVTHDTRTLSEGPISWVIANPRTASALEKAREVCTP